MIYKKSYKESRYGRIDGTDMPLTVFLLHLQHYHFAFDVLDNCARTILYGYTVYWLLHAVNARALS